MERFAVAAIWQFLVLWRKEKPFDTIDQSILLFQWLLPISNLEVSQNYFTMPVSFTKLLHSSYKTVLAMNYILIIFASLFRNFCLQLIYRSKCFINQEVFNLPKMLLWFIKSMLNLVALSANGIGKGTLNSYTCAIP